MSDFNISKYILSIYSMYPHKNAIDIYDCILDLCITKFNSVCFSDHYHSPGFGKAIKILTKKVRAILYGSN